MQRDNMQVPSSLSEELLYFGSNKRWPQIRPDQYASGGGIPMEAGINRRTETAASAFRNMRGAVTSVNSDRRDTVQSPMMRPSRTIQAAYERMAAVIRASVTRGYWNAEELGGINAAPPRQGFMGVNSIDAPNDSDATLARKMRGI